MNGRMHVFDMLVEKGTKRALRCQHKDFCPGRVWVNLDNSFHSTRREHTCDLSTGELTRAQVYAHVHQRAMTSVDIPACILIESTSMVSATQ